MANVFLYVFSCILLFISLVKGQEELTASCYVDAESGIPDQRVSGLIILDQASTGGDVTLTIDLEGFDPFDGEDVHGFHIHQSGDLSNQCSATGGHYNPFGHTHAAPYNTTRHVGDLGNVNEDSSGVVRTIIVDHVISLRSEDGLRNVIGKAIVIHATRDDLGLGGNPGSLTTGNAGPRLACCVINMI